ncbi:hypothetical protein P8C59_000307 [Phyllachora maydis]|uniref:Beta-glucosidase cel3A n=1 Tax=Phyllachora maydis TaxID=1825666 RepID=A0AAD9M673_9PEZI|nr:hypothetical protein P8C59_000307 [Phyllachora maydis]
MSNVTHVPPSAWGGGGGDDGGGTLRPRDAVPDGFVAAPYYPTPRGGWLADWNASYAKAQAMVSSMTLAERTNITAGSGYLMGPCVGNTGSATRLGFPQLCLMDSALGIASTDNNTAFPAGITAGATWDKSLMYQRGVAIGEEFRCKGANVFLGPVVGPMGRKPLAGRIWEGFGADPVLQGFGAYLTIQAVQQQGVIATIKHLIGNEQERYRMNDAVQSGYSANIDDRTMHELYLWPFAQAVRAGVGAVMAAYNAVNGSACSQNSYLLNGLLKDELGFQGFALGQIQDIYTEGLYIDYRYLNKNNMTARFAFGHGLSYTQFTYTNATITAVTPLTALPPTRPAKGSTPVYSSAIPPAAEAVAPSGFHTIWRYLYSWLSASDAAAASTSSHYAYPAGYSTTQTAGPPAGGGPGGNPALFDVAYTVALTVTNTGTRYAGKAVAQAYVQFPVAGNPARR